MTITARFAGRCTDCHSPIAIGERIEWTRGTNGSRHTVCPTPVMNMATPSAPLPKGPRLSTSATIVDFLTKASAHLKKPKVRFLAPDGASELRLSLAPKTGRNPGAVYLTVQGEYLGRINADGTCVGRFEVGMMETLTKIATDPAVAAAAYGALMGRCSFCNLQLTDEGSVEAGYGPICAKHYGLPHKALGTKAVKVVGDVTPAAAHIVAPDAPAAAPVVDEPPTPGEEDPAPVVKKPARFDRFGIRIIE